MYKNFFGGPPLRKKPKLAKKPTPKKTFQGLTVMDGDIQLYPVPKPKCIPKARLASESALKILGILQPLTSTCALHEDHPLDTSFTFGQGGTALVTIEGFLKIHFLPYDQAMTVVCFSSKSKLTFSDKSKHEWEKNRSIKNFMYSIWCLAMAILPSVTGFEETINKIDNIVRKYPHRITYSE